jgi:hypothetical protein
MRTLTQQQMARHPFIAGVAIVILGPYILAFLLLLAVFFVIAAALDLICTRK